MTASRHAQIHGLLNNMAESIAIKREIIYELAKEIPSKEIPDIVDQCWEANINYMTEKRRRRTWKRKGGKSNEHKN